MVRVYHWQGAGNMAADAQTTTRVCRVLIGLAVLWGVLGLSGRESWAFDDEIARATLRRVESVQVVVAPVAPDVARAGLTRQQLQTDVEVQLQQAGIRARGTLVVYPRQRGSEP
jgi:hypothetical protein